MHSLATACVIEEEGYTDGPSIRVDGPSNPIKIKAGIDSSLTARSKSDSFFLWFSTHIYVVCCVCTLQCCHCTKMITGYPVMCFERQDFELMQWRSEPGRLGQRCKKVYTSVRRGRNGVSLIKN